MYLHCGSGQCSFVYAIYCAVNGVWFDFLSVLLLLLFSVIVTMMMMLTVIIIIVVFIIFFSFLFPAVWLVFLGGRVIECLPGLTDQSLCDVIVHWKWEWEREKGSKCLPGSAAQPLCDTVVYWKQRRWGRNRNSAGEGGGDLCFCIVCTKYRIKLACFCTSVFDSSSPPLPPLLPSFPLSFSSSLSLSLSLDLFIVA